LIEPFDADDVFILVLVHPLGAFREVIDQHRFALADFKTVPLEAHQHVAGGVVGIELPFEPHAQPSMVIDFICNHGVGGFFGQG
jgi:hypothetical protein